MQTNGDVAKRCRQNPKEVCVYDEKGLLVPVDDLAEAVQPGNAVVARVSLNLYVGYRCGHFRYC